MTTKKKIRLTKKQMIEVLMYYTHELTRIYAYRPITDSLLYLANEKIAVLRDKGRRFSTNPAWDVEVVVKANGLSGFSVDVADDTNLLYLDFDS